MYYINILTWNQHGCCVFMHLLCKNRSQKWTFSRLEAANISRMRSWQWQRFLFNFFNVSDKIWHENDQIEMQWSPLKVNNARAFWYHQLISVDSHLVGIWSYYKVHYIINKIWHLLHLNLGGGVCSLGKAGWTHLISNGHTSQPWRTPIELCREICKVAYKFLPDWPTQIILSKWKKNRFFYIYIFLHFSTDYSKNAREKSAKLLINRPWPKGKVTIYWEVTKCGVDADPATCIILPSPCKQLYACFSLAVVGCLGSRLLMLHWPLLDALEHCWIPGTPCRKISGTTRWNHGLADFLTTDRHTPFFIKLTCSLVTMDTGYWQ